MRDVVDWKRALVCLIATLAQVTCGPESTGPLKAPSAAAIFDPGICPSPEDLETMESAVVWDVTPWGRCDNINPPEAIIGGGPQGPLDIPAATGSIVLKAALSEIGERFEGQPWRVRHLALRCGYDSGAGNQWTRSWTGSESGVMGDVGEVVTIEYAVHFSDGHFAWPDGGGSGLWADYHYQTVVDFGTPVRAFGIRI